MGGAAAIEEKQIFTHFLISFGGMHNNNDDVERAMHLYLITFHANFPPYAAHIPRMHPALFMLSLHVHMEQLTLFSIPMGIACRCPDLRRHSHLYSLAWDLYIRLTGHTIFRSLCQCTEISHSLCNSYSETSKVFQET